MDMLIKLPPTSKWQWFKYTDLFTIETRQRITQARASANPGPYNYITHKTTDNGIAGKVSFKTDEGNVITVAGRGDGGKPFYQVEPFAATSEINILIPKFELNPYLASFLIALIELESPKYSFGRGCSKTRIKKSLIKLPTKNGKPDWELMEQYTKQQYTTLRQQIVDSLR